MNIAVGFSIAQMIVEIAISTTIKFYGIYRLCLSTLRANSDLSPHFWFVGFHVFASCHKLEILYSVVFFVFVYMVNDLVWKQKTTDILFHYKDMLGDIFPVKLCPWMTDGTYEDVFPIVSFAAFPKGKLLHRITSFYEGLKSPCFAISFPCFGKFGFCFGGMPHRVIIS